MHSKQKRPAANIYDHLLIKNGLDVFSRTIFIAIPNSPIKTILPFNSTAKATVWLQSARIFYTFYANQKTISPDNDYNQDGFHDRLIFASLTPSTIPKKTSILLLLLFIVKNNIFFSSTNRYNFWLHDNSKRPSASTATGLSGRLIKLV